MDCAAEDLRLFSITGDWSTPHFTLGPGIAQYENGAIGLWPRG